tara:strand:+ start:180 stop:1385 length:1206 start_codon:yes stop_codon:yes gene_type:complete
MRGAKTGVSKSMKVLKKLNTSINTNIIIRGLLATIVVMLVILFLRKVCNFNPVTEMFTSYKRCEQVPIKGLYRQILDEEGVDLEQDLDKFDLYYPCGYNKIEKELRELSLKDYQNVFGICGCDTIASKSSLWKTLENYYGREKARQYMPESYILRNDEQLDNFKRIFDPSRTYILKKNIQRKKGIKISNNLDEIVKARNDKFVLVQEKVDSLIINKRRMNLRIYLVVKCREGYKELYMHDNAKCLYTSKDVDESKVNGGTPEEFESLITNSYVTELNIYNKNPLTLNQLCEYVTKTFNVPKEIFMASIEENLKVVFKALLTKLCNCENIHKNGQFQLFGADVILDESLKPYILEINKGPDMKHKDEADRLLKKKVIFDTFNLMNVVKPKTADYQNMFRKLI